MFLHGRTMFAPTMRVVGELTHTRSVCVGVAETGAEGGRHRLTDEAFINNLQ